RSWCPFTRRRNRARPLPIGVDLLARFRRCLVNETRRPAAYPLHRRDVMKIPMLFTPTLPAVDDDCAHVELSHHASDDLGHLVPPETRTFLRRGAHVVPF